MILSIFILAIIGLCMSAYGYLLEIKLKNEPDYKAACDISDKISCTKPMLSEYANIFYFSNTVIGVVFYALVAMLAAINSINLLFFAALLSVLVSIYLGYLLYFKIKSLCIICTSLYIINLLILIIASRLFMNS